MKDIELTHVDQYGNWMPRPRRLHVVTVICLWLCGLILACMAMAYFCPNRVSFPLALSALAIGWVIMLCASVLLFRKTQALRQETADLKRIMHEQAKTPAPIADHHE